MPIKRYRFLFSRETVKAFEALKQNFFIMNKTIKSQLSIVKTIN